MKIQIAIAFVVVTFLFFAWFHKDRWLANIRKP